MHPAASLAHRVTTQKLPRLIVSHARPIRSSWILEPSANPPASTAALDLSAPTARRARPIARRPSTELATTCVKSEGNAHSTSLSILFLSIHFSPLSSRFNSVCFSPPAACSTFTCLTSVCAVVSRSIVPTISHSRPRVSRNQLSFIFFFKFIASFVIFAFESIAGKSVDLPDDTDTFAECGCFRRKQSPFDTISSDIRRPPAWHNQRSPVWGNSGP